MSAESQAQFDCPLSPFLKWAGGKRWFSTKYGKNFPKDYSTYIEPFLGSAAVYFNLRPKRAILSDSNTDLIDTYLSIRNNWSRVQSLLSWHQDMHSKEHYYKIRGKKYKDLYFRASRLIYLNRTCWNGLYRVNSSGSFNVPIGTKSRVLLDTDCFEQISLLLQHAKLCACDFEKTIDLANKGDLIFADPPYTALHKNNGFIKYNDKLFSWDDQVRLYHALQRAKSRGASIVLTNADHESTRELFSTLGAIHTLERASIIAARSKDRTRANEIVIYA